VDRLRYPARFYHDPEDPEGFTVWIPDINSNGIGICTQGDTLEEAHEMARDALTGCLLAKHDMRAPIDEPGPLPEGPEWEWVYPEPQVEVALLIRNLRQRNNMTQKQAAALLDIPYTTYQRWENPDKCNATLKTLDRIARAFGCDLDVSFRPRKAS